MAQEKLTRAEAIQYLTMQRDYFEMASTPENKLSLEILKEAGKQVGYAPAFRCLVSGLTPEESIRWGK